MAQALLHSPSVTRLRARTLQRQPHYLNSQVLLSGVMQKFCIVSVDKSQKWQISHVQRSPIGCPHSLPLLTGASTQRLMNFIPEVQQAPQHKRSSTRFLVPDQCVAALPLAYHANYLGYFQGAHDYSVLNSASSCSKRWMMLTQGGHPIRMTSTMAILPTATTRRSVSKLLPSSHPPPCRPMLRCASFAAT